MSDGARHCRLFLLLLALLMASVGGASDREALLAGIRAKPDDDAARLVFADWLDENGDAARAEFIRVQVEAARLPHDSARWDTLEERASELLKANERRWLPKGWGTKGWSTMSVRWERGFPASFDLSLALYNGTPEVRAMIDSLELLSEIRLIGYHPGALKFLNESKIIQNIASLRLGPSRNLVENEEEWAALLSAAKGLTRLDLNQVRLLPSALRVLARSPVGKRLRALNLSQCYPSAFPGPLLDILAEGGFPALEELDLRGNYFGSLAALAEKPKLPALKRLMLDGHRTPQAQTDLLIRGPLFRQLQSLDIDCDRSEGDHTQVAHTLDLIAQRDHSLVELYVGAKRPILEPLAGQIMANRARLECYTLVRVLSDY